MYSGSLSDIKIHFDDQKRKSAKETCTINTTYDFASDPHAEVTLLVQNL